MLKLGNVEPVAEKAHDVEPPEFVEGMAITHLANQTLVFTGVLFLYCSTCSPADV